MLLAISDRWDRLFSATLWTTVTADPCANEKQSLHAAEESKFYRFCCDVRFCWLWSARLTQIYFLPDFVAVFYYAVLTADFCHRLRRHFRFVAEVVVCVEFFLSVHMEESLSLAITKTGVLSFSFCLLTFALWFWNQTCTTRTLRPSSLASCSRTLRHGLALVSNDFLNARRCWLVKIVRGRLGPRRCAASAMLPILPRQFNKLWVDDPRPMFDVGVRLRKVEAEFSPSSRDDPDIKWCRCWRSTTNEVLDADVVVGDCISPLPPSFRSTEQLLKVDVEGSSFPPAATDAGVMPCAASASKLASRSKSALQISCPLRIIKWSPLRSGWPHIVHMKHWMW